MPAGLAVSTGPNGLLQYSQSIVSNYLQAKQYFKIKLVIFIQTTTYLLKLLWVIV